jgi:hypothetical protein
MVGGGISVGEVYTALYCRKARTAISGCCFLVNEAYCGFLSKCVRTHHSRQGTVHATTTGLFRVSYVERQDIDGAAICESRCAGGKGLNDNGRDGKGRQCTRHGQWALAMSVGCEGGESKGSGTVSTLSRCCIADQRPRPGLAVRPGCGPWMAVAGTNKGVGRTNTSRSGTGPGRCSLFAQVWRYRRICDGRRWSSGNLEAWGNVHLSATILAACIFRDASGSVGAYP